MADCKIIASLRKLNWKDNLNSMGAIRKFPEGEGGRTSVCSSCMERPTDSPLSPCASLDPCPTQPSKFVLSASDKVARNCCRTSRFPYSNAGRIPLRTRQACWRPQIFYKRVTMPRGSSCQGHHAHVQGVLGKMHAQDAAQCKIFWTCARSRAVQGPRGTCKIPYSARSSGHVVRVLSPLCNEDMCLVTKSGLRHTRIN